MDVGRDGVPQERESDSERSVKYLCVFEYCIDLKTENVYCRNGQRIYTGGAQRGMLDIEIG